MNLSKLSTNPQKSRKIKKQKTRQHFTPDDAAHSIQNQTGIGAVCPNGAFSPNSLMGSARPIYITPKLFGPPFMNPMMMSNNPPNFYMGNPSGIDQRLMDPNVSNGRNSSCGGNLPFSYGIQQPMYQLQQPTMGYGQLPPAKASDLCGKSPNMPQNPPPLNEQGTNTNQGRSGGQMTQPPSNGSALMEDQKLAAIQNEPNQEAINSADPAQVQKHAKMSKDGQQLYEMPQTLPNDNEADYGIKNSSQRMDESKCYTNTNNIMVKQEEHNSSKT